MCRRCVAVLSCLFGLVAIQDVAGQEFQLHKYERQQLTDVYFSEGANFGDIDHDGKPDVVHGPYWWKGPEFTKRHEIFPAKPQNRDGYSNNFFTWIADFSGDGWNDLVSVGLPGSPALLYVNPGNDTTSNPAANWGTIGVPVFDGVGNESPQFVNLVGDEKPELVCNQKGKFGYAVPSWKNASEKWSWHPISPEVGEFPFGHGLGVGDVNGDGLQDVIWKGGWYEQPKSLKDNPLWTFHKYQFAGPGGADMFVYDVDGDGDNDVITSLAAHTFGLAWFEQVKEADGITFKKHVIMGEKPEDSPYGVLFTEPHAVAFHDMDGDGLKDIITGKTYWSHHRQSPMWDAGAVTYWFKLVRGKDGIDWVPYRADDEAGIGRQLSVGDIDGDKLPDIVAGGMKGAHILRQKLVKVSEEEYKAAQPKKLVAMADGLTPEQAAARMTVPEGFKVQLAAGEPLVHQPVAFTIDERGRIWVAEAYTYPNRAKEGEGKDKIIILEDTDGDGTFENRKVFIEGLNLVSGLEVGFGGVWVGAAPYLLFIPDANHDDVPDGPASGGGQPPDSKSTTSNPQKVIENEERRIRGLTPAARQDVKFPNDVPPGATVLLDGFGWQDTHETLNAFIWGPDGWLYGCHGVFTHSKVGKPGTADEQRQGLNAGVWRYHPTKHLFEVFSHGTSNPWGVDFNEHGQAFISACVIPHLWHMIQGGRYHRQGGQHFNPYTFEDIQTIADHLHYVGNIRDHAWWGHEPKSPTDTLAAGGGHAHAGAMIYLGNNWPEKYRNQIFMHNIHGNRVNECLLEPRGSGYIGHRAPDLLVANDSWFRGLNLKYGPDGSVYLIDWYDKNACHRTNPEIWDRTNGRIYNIKYTGGDSKIDSPESKAKVVTDLAKLKGEIRDLVDLLGHPNEWFVRMARRKLQERYFELSRRSADSSLLSVRKQFAPLLNERFRATQDIPGKLRLLWTMHAAYDAGDVVWECLNTEGPGNEYLRAWAIQLILESNSAPGTIGKKLVELAGQDPSPVVRRYLASGLQRMEANDRWEIAAALLSHADDAQDHNLPFLYWYGVEPLVAADPARAIALAKTAKVEKVSRLIVRRAAATDETANAAVAWLAEAQDAPAQQMLLDEILLGLEGRANIPQPAAWGPAYESLLKSETPAIRDRADQIAVAFGDKRILPRMRDLLSDAKAPIEKRQRALDLLVKGRDAEAAPALRVALNEATLRGPAIRALAAHDDADSMASILSLYPKLTEVEKRDAINTLVARPKSASSLFDAIEKETIPRTDVHAYHVQQLLGFKDDGLSKRITAVWGEIRATAKDKQALIAKHKSELTAARLKSADLSNGRRLFVKTCAACHVLFGEGGKIGPDITGSNRANLDYILENVLDPSAIVGKDYRMTILNTQDGRVIAGLILKETDSAVTLKTINDTVVIPKADIEERKLSELSLMPEGQLNQLTPDEQRDLIAYLGTPNQVAMRGPKAAIEKETGHVAGALEGEALKIVAKTGGSAASQNMQPFTLDKWSGNDHLWWTGAGPGGRLGLELPVKNEGQYDIELQLTMARDYAIVQVLIDGEPLGEPIDCYNPEVITTGVLTFGPRKLTAGPHRIGFQIIGANPKAVPAHMVGIDYIKLTPKPE